MKIWENQIKNTGFRDRTPGPYKRKFWLMACAITTVNNRSKSICITNF